jgi:hypothetical protein
MAQLTRAQLTDQLIALREHCNKLEVELASLRADAAQPAVHPLKGKWTPRRDEAAERAHEQYVATLLRARDQAMRSGRSVLVAAR